MKGSENSNLFIFYNELTGRKLSITAMTVVGLSACLLMLLPMWWMKKKKMTASLEMLLLLGFLLYNAYEFCSPITRGNYTFVQFIFPLLLLVIFIRRVYLLPIITLLAGIYLNIAVLPAVKMEHSIGQFLIMAAIFYLVYRNLLPSRLTENKWHIRQQVFIA
jgi:hypothetical protein